MIRVAATAAISRTATTPTATPKGMAVLLFSRGGCPSGGGYRRHSSDHHTPDRRPYSGRFKYLK